MHSEKEVLDFLGDIADDQEFKWQMKLNETTKSYYIGLETWSPKNQDFCIEFDDIRSAKDLIHRLEEYAENYDPSEEASLWVDETGHGKNGAPYDLEDILDDMKWCKKVLTDLAEVMNKTYNHYSKIGELKRFEPTPKLNINIGVEYDGQNLYIGTENGSGYKYAVSSPEEFYRHCMECFAEIISLESGVTMQMNDPKTKEIEK